MTIKVKRMAIGLLLSVLLLLVLNRFLSYPTKPSQSLKTQSFAAERQQQLQAFIQRLQHDFPVPGIGIAIVSGDSVFYCSAGVKNEAGEPFSVNTPVFTGCLSEPVMASAILKLQEQGKVNLDDPVIKYLPYFQMGGDTYKKVTLRNLLTHTSGIQKYEMIWDLPNYKPDAPEVTTRSIASQLPKFAPGSRISRSPYNYDILADIINKVTGSPFEGFINREIFRPCNMEASTFLKPQGQKAMPFKINNWLKYSYKQDTLYPYNRENAGSNGFHTTTEEVSRWMRMVLDKGWYKGKTVLNEGSERELTSVQFASASNKGIALGFDVMKQDGQSVLIKSSHYGGFNSELVLIPEKRIGVAVFSNISGYLNISSISRQLASWLEGKVLVYPKIPVNIALGKKLEATGNIDSVLKEYERLKQKSSARYDCSVDALHQFGANLLYKIRDRSKAIRLFEYATLRFPKSASAHMYLAEAYILNKDLENSKKSFAKAKALAANGDFNQQQAAYIEENILVLEEKKQG